jgi:diamine N-acetyltransferase
MNIRLIEKKDLPRLLKFAKKTFSEAFAHLNNPDDFEAYLQTAFTAEKLEHEFNTEGVLFYVITKEYDFTDDTETIAGFLKLNIASFPDSTTVFHTDFTYKKQDLLEIERIYVDTPFHGKGIAQLLMQHTEAVARENNCLHIWLGVWSENAKAIRFYEKMGFTKFGQHIFTIGTDDQTDFLMIKKL